MTIFFQSGSPPCAWGMTLLSFGRFGIPTRIPAVRIPFVLRA